ncbi:hypothetical protein LXL04_021952 [Taraxacum kok-saghyz]
MHAIKRSDHGPSPWSESESESDAKANSPLIMQHVNGWKIATSPPTLRIQFDWVVEGIFGNPKSSSSSPASLTPHQPKSSMKLASSSILHRIKHTIEPFNGRKGAPRRVARRWRSHAGARQNRPGRCSSSFHAVESFHSHQSEVPLYDFLSYLWSPEFNDIEVICKGCASEPVWNRDRVWHTARTDIQTICVSYLEHETTSFRVLGVEEKEEKRANLKNEVFHPSWQNAPHGACEFCLELHPGACGFHTGRVEFALGCTQGRVEHAVAQNVPKI